METEQVADDITSAECLLSRHDERKAEIESREETFGLLIANGKSMIENKHYSAEDVRKWLHKEIYYKLRLLFECEIRIMI